MSKAVTCTKSYEAAPEKKSLWKTYKEEFKKNKASIICGLIAMNGNTYVYPVYKSLKA